MSRRLASVLVVSLLVLGGVLWLRSGTERSAGPALADAPLAAAARPALEPSEAVPTEPAEVVEVESEGAREAVATVVEEATEEQDERTLVTVSARFVDESGLPLAGIELSAQSIADSPVAVSDGAGLAELVLDWEDLGGFFPQPCSFLVRGRGFVTRGDRQWFGAPEDKFLGEIPMLLGGDVRGRVVDASGLGIEGALVRSVQAVLVDSPERDELRTWGGRPLSTWAITESAGSFVIEGLPVTALSIDAQATGTFHAISAPVTIRAGETIELPDLVLEPAPEGQRIGGVVRAESGEPVVGAGIRLLDEKRDYIKGRVLTDARGAFAFTVALRELYALQVLDYSTNGWPDVNLDGIEPGTTDLEVVFEGTRPLRVVVTGSGGRPVRRFLANVTTMDNKVVPGGYQTSEDGEPVDLKRPQAEYRVGVHAPGYEYARLGPFSAEDEQEELVVTLEPTTGLVGKVMAAGKPLAGVAVEAHAELPEGRLGLAADVFHVFLQTRGFLGDVTGPNGEFFLNAPQAARFHVHAKADGYARAESGPLDFDPAQGNAELVLALQPGGAVEGHLLVGPNAKAHGRTVAVSRGDGHFETAVTDVEGAYSFDDLAPGPWQIAEVDTRELERASSGSLSWLTPDTETPWDFEVAAGETTRFDLDLASQEVCRFEGRFLVDGKTPIGWTWSVPTVRGLYNERFDSEGRFSFELEESGPRFVHLIAPRTPGASSGLRLEVELFAGLNEWAGGVDTGTLELAGVDAPALEDLDLGGQVDMAYTLLADLPGGLSWFGNVFAADGGKTRLLRVPAGDIRLYEGEYARVIGGPEPEPRLEFDLAPGETKTVALD